jgi:hypothetical protein
MMNLVRQMRESLNIKDLLLIISIALFLPLPLALPLAARIVNNRINDRAHTARDAENRITPETSLSAIVTASA